MANPVCLSPLKFYDNVNKQEYHKSYAYGHISPLIARLKMLPPFQFVIPSELDANNIFLTEAYIVDAKTGERVYGNFASELIEIGFTISKFEYFNVAYFSGNLPIRFNREGIFYIELISNTWKYYSEVFSFTSSVDDCIEIEYWNRTNSFFIKNGIIVFPSGFHFKILLRTEVGKPEYSFEEEGTKRLGYTFIESQVSKKTYKFNVVIPEFICDALRIIRLCDNKFIRNKGDEYEAITFEMEAEWQTQGDLASVNCEFDVDNVIVNLGGFVPASGDFNDDFNNDFRKD